jgi:tetratricopeptide (TPR) repeat protein
LVIVFRFFITVNKALESNFKESMQQDFFSLANKNDLPALLELVEQLDFSDSRNEKIVEWALELRVDAYSGVVRSILNMVLPLKLLHIDNDCPETYRLIGLIQLRLKNYNEALQYLNHALALTPSSAEINGLIGDCYVEQGFFQKASVCFEKAAALAPKISIYYAKIAHCKHYSRRFDEAFDVIRKGFKLDKKSLQLAIVASNCSKDHSDFDSALKYFDKLLAKTPDLQLIKFYKSLVLLKIGGYAEGFALYQSRHVSLLADNLFFMNNFVMPQWQGQSLKGKSILVMTEQGFGDQIQFCRYAAVLKRFGASKVIWVVQSPLLELLSSNPFIDEVASIANMDCLKSTDYYIFSLDLPLYCRTTLEVIPDQLPYLFANQAKIKEWQKKMPQKRLKVGLVWKGSGGHKNDMNRSISSLAVLKPLWQVDGVDFISLQKGNGEDEAMLAASDQSLLELGSKIKDFNDTAAIIMGLDLLISVDSAPAHLAGALNKPCWILLPFFDTDWRWLVDRDDSPWYPGAVRLFRQASDECWGEVIQRVVNELHIYASINPVSAPRRGSWGGFIDKTKNLLSSANQPKLSETRI